MANESDLGLENRYMKTFQNHACFWADFIASNSKDFIYRFLWQKKCFFPVRNAHDFER